MAIFLIGSDMYLLIMHFRRPKSLMHFPTIDVVIPAFNEQKSILRAIQSVIQNTYPQDKIQVVVVDDGSTDRTVEVVQQFVRHHHLKHVSLISQRNMGKAHALNNGMKQSTADLVMCLDADSYLNSHALARAVPYFENTKVMALASNVKVARRGEILNLTQVFEYTISYHMKKALTAFNIEYIIGGVGSLFRRKFLEEIGYYDGNTVTEDIDLTMKILQRGNRTVRVVYGSDVIAYTQGALTVPDLIRQRHRWKWGRYQTFLKNRKMFFSKDKRHTKGLSWIYLPYALYSDIAFLFEPVVLLYLLYIIVYYRDITTLFSSVSVITFNMGMSILAEDTLSWKDKVLLILLSPLMYFLFYLLSYVEYMALIKSVVNMRKLKRSLRTDESPWTPITRVGFSSS